MSARGSVNVSGANIVSLLQEIRCYCPFNLTGLVGYADTYIEAETEYRMSTMKTELAEPGLREDEPENNEDDIDMLVDEEHLDIDDTAPNDTIADPFASSRVMSSGESMLAYDRKKQPHIASVDDALARARYENGHDDEKMVRIAGFIAKFHNSVAGGKQNNFSNNNYLRSIRLRCQRALTQYTDTGVIDDTLVPSNEEMLAMRYCSPRCEVNATIASLLASMGLGHLISAGKKSLAPQEDIAENAADEVDAVMDEKSQGSSEADDIIEGTDGMACLKAKVQALEAQIKAILGENFVTHDDVGHLANKIKVKLSEQRQAAEKADAELADKIAAVGKKHDTKIAAIVSKHDQLEKDVNLANAEMAALDGKHVAQGKEIGDLAKKVEETAEKVVAIDKKHGQLDKDVNFKLVEDNTTTLEAKHAAQRKHTISGLGKKLEKTSKQPTLLPQSAQSLKQLRQLFEGAALGRSGASEKKRKRDIFEVVKSPPTHKRPSPHSVRQSLSPPPRALSNIRDLYDTEDKIVPNKSATPKSSIRDYSFDD